MKEMENRIATATLLLACPTGSHFFFLSLSRIFHLFFHDFAKWVTVVGGITTTVPLSPSPPLVPIAK